MNARPKSFGTTQTGRCYFWSACTKAEVASMQLVSSLACQVHVSHCDVLHLHRQGQSSLCLTLPPAASICPWSRCLHPTRQPRTTLDPNPNPACINDMQGAVAAGNVSETIYMAESLYLRFDIPIIMPDVMEALKAKGFDVSNINSTHVFFTVGVSQRGVVEGAY